ncbi:hypothetical protein SAMN05444412_11369 [Rhodonellum ikkaensis]|uniref:Uncharacterized protein n=1 Tax=Rhodonellum ikkaensis TaxID=336829 RepID=A0A1H3SSA4_9BACT|nr:hypothetical protein SAMN05444412_11369 [Rhodonellum ikkaensis]
MKKEFPTHLDSGYRIIPIHLRIYGYFTRMFLIHQYAFKYREQFRSI